MRLLAELAETLQAPVHGGRMPSHHPLERRRQRCLWRDVILGLNQSGLYGLLNDYRDQAIKEYATPIKRADAKVISISSHDYYMRANFQTIDRYQYVDMSIAGDAEASLPSLIEACKKLMTSDRRVAIEARGKKYADAGAQSLQRGEVGKYVWMGPQPDQHAAASCVELYDVIKDKDWASVGGGGLTWDYDKYYRRMGESNGGGVGGIFLFR